MNPSSILTCTNTTQLADFCALAVPAIWGPIKQQQPMKRTIAFKQFCQKIIKATQISCACVVLGLYYIHRLRSAYPYIHASIGSEVRLFTTALVLANKYLDDNTFTNKTWSEVSSIPVLELNIMEMEFLSALHYNIHLRHDHFFQWVQQCQQWIPTNNMILQPRSIKVPISFSDRSSSPTSTTKTTTITSSPSSSLLLSSQQVYKPITPFMPPTPSVSTPNLKRSYHDIVDDHHQSNKKRSNYHPTKMMPYTPPESFQPIPMMDSLHHSSYPTPTYTSHDYPPILPSSLSTSVMNNITTSTINDCCRPILSWSSSSSALASSRHRIGSSMSTSALSASGAAPHYSTSLLATRVQCLEID
ncbi:cyclin-domain-containing protein [Halteromyces radiatus]|uniref:cyclin-domain-containing protein n=1 Tax=Halteromyces radiatus TaxID=101107 RepID=UPI00221E641D|nr:cyclin-domain-containing protein [Halteromyces radiatus]KAI8096928.1 cyclin-domain-containing protein [Halteromyces radiatus]